MHIAARLESEDDMLSPPSIDMRNAPLTRSEVIKPGLRAGRDSAVPRWSVLSKPSNSGVVFTVHGTEVPDYFQLSNAARNFAFVIK